MYIIRNVRVCPRLIRKWPIDRRVDIKTNEQPHTFTSMGGFTVGRTGLLLQL